MKGRLSNGFAMVLLALGSMAQAAAASAALPLSRLELPPGFRIELFARVPNARQMALGTRTLFVGSMRAGKVYAVPLSNPAKPVVIADGLEMPVGVAFRDGDLYVSAVSRILRLRDIEARLDAPPRPEVVSQAYPADTHHGWKFIAFGPDGKLYVPVGAPCNICEPAPDRYATITRLDVVNGEVEVVARGVRNTVGFDWQPQSGELWFTDNGRDWLGDDAPPDELNRLLTLNLAGPGDAANSRRRCRIWARMWRVWACVSIAAGNSPRATAMPSSSPSTVPGTAAKKAAIA
jgi:glucose/arabinose dehydrogenase